MSDDDGEDSVARPPGVGDQDWLNDSVRLLQQLRTDAEREGVRRWPDGDPDLQQRGVDGVAVLPLGEDFHLPSPLLPQLLLTDGDGDCEAQSPA